MAITLCIFVYFFFRSSAPLSRATAEIRFSRGAPTVEISRDKRSGPSTEIAVNPRAKEVTYILRDFRLVWRNMCNYFYAMRPAAACRKLYNMYIYIYLIVSKLNARGQAPVDSRPGITIIITHRAKTRFSARYSSSSSSSTSTCQPFAQCPPPPPPPYRPQEMLRETAILFRISWLKIS